MKSRFRSILYRLNENVGSSTNLLVGTEILYNHYTEDGSSDNDYLGIIESMTNENVIIRDNHTQECHNFTFNGFNAHKNGIEFICEDKQLRFYVYN